MTSSQFLVDALKLKPLMGIVIGGCVLCGCITRNGFLIKDKASFIFAGSFTDFNKAAIPTSNMICPDCITMGKTYKFPGNQLENKSIPTVWKSRLSRSVVLQSGKVLFIGNYARLKWLLHNMPNEPFLLCNQMADVKNFSHLLWYTKVSLDKKGFYYCDKKGNHFIRLNRIQNIDMKSDLTVKEQELHRLYHGDHVTEKPLHPRNKKYNTTESKSGK